MSAFALYLVLAAALLQASWNLLAKKAGGGNHFVLLAALFVTLLWAPAAVWVGLAAVERLGALTGALIAGYSVVDGDAVKMLLLSPILVDCIGNLLRVPVMRPFARPDRRGFLRTLRSQWPRSAR